MLGKARSLAFRWLRRGATLSDLALASLGQPRLFLAAFRHITRRRARILQSGLRAADRASASEPAHPPQPLGRDRILADLAKNYGLLLLAENGEHIRLGVAEVDLLSVLNLVAQAAQADRVMIANKQILRDTRNFRRQALAAREITIDITRPDASPDSITLEPYFLQEDGKWVSANPNNTEARALYDDRLESPGLTRVSDLLGAPSFDQRWRLRAIDAVYTWVNHADPDWAALYHQHRTALADDDAPAGRPRPLSDDATALTRFHSNDELRYSLRSVAENLPWLRNIHVLSNCAPPPWLNIDHGRVRWVQHEQVIPQQYLPTFNSHVIESFLHRIKGLSTHFLYLNDDFFVARPLPGTFFFDENGASRALLEPYGKVLGATVEGAPDYLNAARNSAALIREAFGFMPTRLHRHSPYALRRDVLDEIDSRWSPELDAMRHNRFRTAQDLNVASFLYHHYGLATGGATLAGGECVLVKSQDIRWRAQLARAMADGPDVFCINEGGAVPPGRDWHRQVRLALDARWPDPAPWETGASAARIIANPAPPPSPGVATRLQRLADRSSISSGASC